MSNMYSTINYILSYISCHETWVCQRHLLLHVIMLIIGKVLTIFLVHHLLKLLPQVFNGIGYSGIISGCVKDKEMIL